MNHKLTKFIRLYLIVTLLVVAAQCRTASCDEVRPKTFLHALQAQGYGDVAVDYLNMLKSKGELPKELRDTWDLEMSKSLRSAARTAYNSAEHDSLLREAEKYLTKFIKENPDRPETFEARAIWANFSMEKALQDLRAVQNTSDKKQQAKLLADTRAALLEARKRFNEVEKKYQAELDSAAEQSPPTKRPDKREVLDRRRELEADLLNYSFQNVLLDYYLAQTYEPDSADRKNILRTAAKGFDALFQANRMEVAGLLAHMWHGKITEELGDWQTALDIYDEVLVNEPEPGRIQADSALLALFAQVEQFRMQILAKQLPMKFMDQAGQWVQQYAKTPISLTESYQAVALDLAKAKFDAAQSSAGKEKTKLITGAMALLADMIKVRSPYQQEAVLLRRQYIKSSGKGEEPGTFDEAVALADAAAVDGQWSEAAVNYAAALKLADKENVNDSLRQEARDALAGAIYMQARGQLIAGKWEDCLATAEKIFKDYKDTPSAPMAGPLAVSAALNMYAAAPAAKKTAALERLKKYAKFTEDAWPGKPEADDARMMLAQADLVQGKIDDALAGFQRIDPRSERYPNALLMAAETYWRRHLAEKEKPEGSRNKSQMDADLAKATKDLEASMQLQRKKLASGTPLTGSLVETQLLLAEIKLSEDNAADAAALLQPLVDTVKTWKTEDLDNVVLRVYVGAVRTYLAQDDPEKAVDVAMLLADSGPDIRNINGALAEAAKMLNAKRKQAEEAAQSAGDGNSTDADQARDKLKSLADLLNKLLVKMSSRKEFSVPAAVYYAEACTENGLPDVARGTYLCVANRAEQDPAYAKSAGKALLLVRARLVDLLAETGDYREAYKQVSQLVAANPRALDLLMTQGRILQSWAKTDPSRYEQAVAHWAKLRNALLSMVKKPPEYFEITYNLAAALYGQASHTEDKNQVAEKAKQAEQLLKSTLVLSPNLNGPEMVDRYNSLLKKASALRRRASSR